MIERFEELKQALEKQHPLSRIEIMSFSSGSIIIDIQVDELFITAKYWGRDKDFGLATLTPESIPFDGYDELFSTYEEFQNRVFELIEAGE